MADRKMGRDTGRLRQEIRTDIADRLKEVGAMAVGFAKAGEIGKEASLHYRRWIEEGNHADMAYLQRHEPLRLHTDNILKGAKTVISLAFSYVPKEWRRDDLPYVAAYAYGEDYHNALRKILKPVIKNLSDQYGGKWRICIDSAPIAERYWAIKSGIGKLGLNGSVIVDGCGGLCFLIEILTTLDLIEDTDDNIEIPFCNKCGICLEVCPGKALQDDGTIDAGRCLNYISIEKKDEFSEEEKDLMKKGKGYLYGCDLCLRVCPHNKALEPSLLEAFQLKEVIRNLSKKQILEMKEEEFKELFKDSPLLYAGYQRLLRNAQD